ncbi:unnamed protein product [Allacma fusca]|uniref:Phosphomevalonate kinase n=1 Tax=Allacma fusca TaxID=39272 RepID=A0A8J2P6U8_9HEXA|nr:unnamed protein product [Allacma fusca]
MSLAIHHSKSALCSERATKRKYIPVILELELLAELQVARRTNRDSEFRKTSVNPGTSGTDYNRPQLLLGVYESSTTHKPPEFKPEILVLISGKRKSGKDYFTDRLIETFGAEKTAILRIAAPIKHYWSVKNNLDYEKMLGTSGYKEQHRFKMVEWSQEVRTKNYGYFNVEAIRMGKAEGKPIWICSDIRHRRDYNWFREFYPDLVKRIRVFATEDVRKSRGWLFTPGIDDGPSECNLDDISDWDLVITNNGQSTDETIPKAVETVIQWHASMNSSPK